MSCAPTDLSCLVNTCSGAGSTGPIVGAQLFNFWQENNCPAAYAQAINTSPTGSLVYNPAAQQVIQQKIVGLFNTYFETNQLTDDVTSPAFNPFQNTLLSLCTDPTLPGVCTQFLNGYCAQFSRAQALNSPTLINFCGCYVPPDPVFLSLTLGSPGCEIGTGCTAGCTAGNPGCTGQPACDPLCHRALTSQKAFQPTGAFITCPQNICVIDNAVVNISSSTVAGGINFNNICSGCGGPSGSDGCLCVVAGVNISATMSSIGVGTNFNQFCSGNSICLIEDSAGNIISEGGCTGINPVNIGTSNILFLPVLGIITLLLLIVLIVLFVSIAARASTPQLVRSTTP